MRHRILICCVMALLAGCSEPSNEVRNAPSNSASSTAIYFPGDVGIDFGKAPAKDEIIETEGKQGRVSIRFVTYELNHDYASIDKQLSEVLGREGYVRTQVQSTKKDRLADIRYSKGSRGVMAYYKEALEGLSKKAILVLYWQQ